MVMLRIDSNWAPNDPNPKGRKSVERLAKPSGARGLTNHIPACFLRIKVEVKIPAKNKLDENFITPFNGELNIITQNNLNKKTGLNSPYLGYEMTHLKPNFRRLDVNFFSTKFHACESREKPRERTTYKN